MYSFSIWQFIREYIGDFFWGGEVPLCIHFQLGNSFGNTYIGDFFFEKFWNAKKINKAQMVDFLTKPFQKMQKKQSRKGGSLKVP